MNSDEHIAGAFLFNLVFSGSKIILTGMKVSIGLHILSSITAILGGLSPDMIEPATSPRHRGVFHYLVGPLSIIPALLLDSSDVLIFSVSSFFMGYFSHFCLDYLM